MQFLREKTVNFLESPKSMRWVGGVLWLEQSPKNMASLDVWVWI